VVQNFLTAKKTQRKMQDVIGLGEVAEPEAK